MIEATDIERARNSNTAEIVEAGSTEAWFTGQGFVPADVEAVAADVTISLVTLALTEEIGVEDLFHSAFMAGLAVGWTLHRDNGDG